MTMSAYPGAAHGILPGPKKSKNVPFIPPRDEEWFKNLHFKGE